MGVSTKFVLNGFEVFWGIVRYPTPDLPLRRS